MRVLALLLALCWTPLVFGEGHDLGGAYYHFSRGKLYELDHQLPEAVQEYEQAIRLHPESSQLHLELAQVLWQMNKIKSAVEEGEAALQLDPENPGAHFLLARIYATFRRGDTGMRGKAIEELEKVLGLDPDQVDAMLYLAQLRGEEGNSREAVRILSRAIQLSPQDSRPYLMQARAYVELRQPEKAIQVLEEAVSLGAYNREHLALLARLYDEQGDIQKSLEYYTRLDRVASTPQVRFGRALALSRLGHFGEALPIFRALVEQFPQQVPFQLGLGEALAGQKRFSEAATVFEAALKEAPENFTANYQLARNWSLLGRRKEAIGLYLKLLQHEMTRPRRLAVLTGLGLLYQQEHQFERAIDYLQKAVSENPDNALARLRLAFALSESGEVKKAVQMSQQLLEKTNGQGAGSGDRKTILIDHAQLLARAGRLAEAVTLLERAARQDQDPEDFLLVASQLYLDQERFRDAEKVVRRGMKRYPESRRMQFQMAAVYEREGKYDSSEALFQKILKANPDHAGALNYLGYMLADRGVRLQEALGYIQKAVAIEPHNGAYLDSLGWVYFKLNRLDLARDNLEAAVAVNDSDPTIYEHLGDLYLKLKQYRQAQRYYEHSLELSEHDSERRKAREKISRLERLLGRQGRAPARRP